MIERLYTEADGRRCVVMMLGDTWSSDISEDFRFDKRVIEFLRGHESDDGFCPGTKIVRAEILLYFQSLGYSRETEIINASPKGITMFHETEIPVGSWYRIICEPSCEYDKYGPIYGCREYAEIFYPEEWRKAT